MKKLLAVASAVGFVAVAGTTFASAAPVMMAAVNPWYVGIGANYSANMTDKVEFVDPTVHSDAVTVDGGELKLNNRGWGGNIFVGYTVNKYFGAELGFSYLGTDTYKGQFATTVDGVEALAGTSKLKLQNQWNIHFVGNAYLPVTDWFQPYAFAGVSYINGQLKETLSPTTTDVVIGGHENTFGGFGLIYGAGLQFNIDQFGIRAYYTQQSTNAISTNSAYRNDINPKDYISLDVLYRFGA